MNRFKTFADETRPVVDRYVLILRNYLSLTLQSSYMWLDSRLAVKMTDLWYLRWQSSFRYKYCSKILDLCRADPLELCCPSPMVSGKALFTLSVLLDTTPRAKWDTLLVTSPSLWYLFIPNLSSFLSSALFYFSINLVPTFYKSFDHKNNDKPKFYRLNMV